MQLADCKCHRLAISLGRTLAETNIELFFRKAVQCITQEEFDKVTKFRYKDDALASLLGRLFLRQATRRLTGAVWHEIEFGRTDKGKPYLLKPSDIKFDMNVSHQGNYVAFASSCANMVGVDCMRIEMDRGGKTADEYINSMAKSASAEELRVMRSQPTEKAKMAYFYRYWCLKEAILKATGEGLLSDLRRLDFRINHAERYRPRCFIISTSVLLDEKLQDQWIFEESFIDETHSVAVCRKKFQPQKCTFTNDPDAKIFFSLVDFEFLLAEATVINALPDDAAHEWTDFNSKPRKTF